MSEQDDATAMGNIQLAVQAAMLRMRTMTVGKVLTYREIAPTNAPVVDVQVAPELLARPVDGQASLSTAIAVKRNVPVGFFQAGDFTVRTKLKPGQHVLLMIVDRELDSWMRGGGDTYRPAIPGSVHNINDMIAFPFLTPEAFQPLARPSSATELYIGDSTGQVCSITLESKPGKVTVKAATTINVEAPAVTLGNSTAVPVAPIARVGLDFIVVPGGGAGGTFPILSGPIPGGPPSAHKVRG